MTNQEHYELICEKAEKYDKLVGVLDEIRAEIIERDRNVKAIRSDGCCFFTVEEVLKIIDKYKESGK